MSAAAQVLMDLREGDLLRGKIRVGGVADVEPDRLHVLGGAAPPRRMLACAVRQRLSDDLCLGERHVDPEAADGLQVSSAVGPLLTLPRRARIVGSNPRGDPAL